MSDPWWPKIAYCTFKPKDLLLAEKSLHYQSETEGL